MLAENPLKHSNYELLFLWQKWVQSVKLEGILVFWNVSIAVLLGYHVCCILHWKLFSVPRAQEKYFENSVLVYSGAGGSDGESGLVPGGVHPYPFSFVLPQNLPSSFEGGVGWVQKIIRLHHHFSHFLLLFFHFFQFLGPLLGKGEDRPPLGVRLNPDAFFHCHQRGGP